MKRILFLVSSMQGGGAERVAALLCNYWVTQGHELSLLPTFSGRGECVYPLDERVRLEYLADKINSRSRSLFNKFRRLLTLRRSIREISPDVIISFLPHVNIAAVIASQGLHVPVIVSERTYPPAMPLGLMLETLRKWAYPRARAVVVQTTQTLNWLSSYSPTSHGYVIANPVAFPLPWGEPNLEPASIINGSSHVILAAGRLGKEKGFDLLLTAFQPLAARYPDWDLVILGEGSERKRLEQQREQLGLTSRVYMPGRVGNLSDWYDRADIYVMSSRFEGFPNTLVEAMAHGVPSIAADCKTGPSEIMRHEVDGLLVPQGDSVSFASALERMISDQTLRVRFAQQAVKVREKFMLKRIAGQWEQLIEEVVGSIQK